MRCIPPEHNAGSVRDMKAVLQVHTRPSDPRHPVGCIDQRPKPLVKETPTPLLGAP